MMTEATRTAAQVLADEWLRIEAEHGPGQTALDLIRCSMAGHSDDTIVAAMHLVPLREVAR